jgi:hypothetical protein
MFGSTFAISAAYSSAPEGERSEALRLTNNGLLIGSVALGATSAAMLARGLATPALPASTPAGSR